MKIFLTKFVTELAGNFPVSITFDFHLWYFLVYFGDFEK